MEIWNKKEQKIAFRAWLVISVLWALFVIFIAAPAHVAYVKELRETPPFGVEMDSREIQKTFLEVAYMALLVPILIAGAWKAFWKALSWYVKKWP